MPDFPLLTDKSHPSPQRRHYRLHGQKPPLKPREVWAIRVRLQIQGALRDLALFNLAIDSKLRSCDLVALRVADVATAGSIRECAMIVQQKTGHPVQFELTDQTRESVLRWITQQALGEREKYHFGRAFAFDVRNAPATCRSLARAAWRKSRRACHFTAGS